MKERPAASIDPWRLEILVVRSSSHSSGERSALRRDTERGLLQRIGPGLYVERKGYESLSPEARHIVLLRAHAAGSTVPPVFSHWSAAVLHDLPVLQARLARVHLTVPDAALRSGAGVAGHVFPLEEQEVVLVQGLFATSSARTVVDVAGGSPFEEGVMAADGVLRDGLPRSALLTASEIAGPRHAAARIADVLAFAHPGAESAAESRYRVTAFRLGVRPPELQRRFVLSNGAVAFLDAYHREADAGVEIDGDRKYLDPSIATDGIERALLAEKRRGAELRFLVSRLARIGWQQAGSTSLLGSVFARIGVHPPRARSTLADYAASAAGARPRRPARRAA